MSQIKIDGWRSHLDPIESQLSDVIHSCVVDALQYPPHKRAHRLFPLERSDFYDPPEPGRTDRYLIIEVSMFEGQTVETKQQSIGLLFDRLDKELGVILFTLASVWCGFAPNIGQLIWARSIQGIGGALLIPSSLAIIGTTFPSDRRGSAIGSGLAIPR